MLCYTVGGKKQVHTACCGKTSCRECIESHARAFYERGADDLICPFCPAVMHVVGLTQMLGATGARRILRLKADAHVQHMRNREHLLTTSRERTDMMQRLSNRLDEDRLRLMEALRAVNEAHTRLKQHFQQVENDPFCRLRIPVDYEDALLTQRLPVQLPSLAAGDGLLVCPREGCGGVVCELVCSRCRGRLCGLCEQSRDDHKPHVCDEGTVASVALIRADSRPCPSCSIRLHRFTGCNHMNCTSCGVRFEWDETLSVSAFTPKAPTLRGVRDFFDNPPKATESRINQMSRRFARTMTQRSNLDAVDLDHLKRSEATPTTAETEHYLETLMRTLLVDERHKHERCLWDALLNCLAQGDVAKVLECNRSFQQFNQIMHTDVPLLEVADMQYLRKPHG